VVHAFVLIEAELAQVADLAEALADVDGVAEVYSVASDDADLVAIIRVRRHEDLAEVVTGALAPIRERTEKLLADEAGLDKLLAHGAQRARPVARETMTQVTERVGFLPAAGAG